MYFKSHTKFSSKKINKHFLFSNLLDVLCNARAGIRIRWVDFFYLRILICCSSFAKLSDKHLKKSAEKYYLKIQFFLQNLK